MLIEEIIVCLKVHEERLRGYEDKEEEKYLLLAHEEWVAWTKKKDANDSSFSSMRGRGSHNKEKRGRECGHGCGGRGRRDNTSQTH